MNKKTFIVVLILLALFTLNFSVAHEIDNSTSEDLASVVEEDTLSVSDVNDTVLSAAAVNTNIEVKSTTDFDVIGDYFKVKLSDSKGKALSNTKLVFSVSGKSYTQNTDSNGIASLQLRLNDGTYKITTKFAGNSNYKSSSLTTTVTMSNTRIVGDDLSSSEIQKIIDNAKVNNVILFNGKSYSDINLVITKSLTLQSNVNTVLKSSSGPVITIKGKSASLTTVKGFDIQSGGDGVVIDDADYVTIVKNTISGKGNGIVATKTSYLNITGNDISKNSKSGIVLGDTASTYIFNNKINSNNQNGIELGKSTKTYIHDNTISSNSKNGIKLTDTVNGKNYGSGPQNVYISKNAISKNIGDGILISKAGNNINIKSNTISANHEDGIAISHIGGNVIQSNVITENWANGIKFFDEYSKPQNQEISYNAIFSNLHMDVEAKDTYYQENGVKLDLGDNWYTDFSGVCPKIKTNNIKFAVTQIGSDLFQATFFDSNGNIASLLPDRTLTYTTSNGQTVSITIKGGAGTFTVDANNGDIVKATVDHSQRDNTYNSNTKSSKPVNGQTPTYTYPSIQNYQLYEDIGTGGGTGNGDGNGNGAEGNANLGNGKTAQDSNSNGNSTHSQKADPSNSANNQVNDVSQSYNTQDTASAGASEASHGYTGNPGSESQSVVKQILLDEDEFFRVAGISFIVLLMILTVGFYYRDDIKEMNSKR